MGKILDFVERNLFHILKFPFGDEHKDLRIDPRILKVEYESTVRFLLLTISTCCRALLRCCLVTVGVLLTKPSVPYKFQMSEPHIIPYGLKSGCLLLFLVVLIASGHCFGGT